MNLLNKPGTQMLFPRNESHCHGAPVYRLSQVLDNKRYVCTECGDWCIPVQKKLEEA